MSKSDSTGGYRRTWWPLFSKEKAIVGHESVFGWADDWRISRMTPEQFYNHQLEVRGVARGSL